MSDVKLLKVELILKDKIIFSSDQNLKSKIKFRPQKPQIFT